MVVNSGGLIAKQWVVRFNIVSVFLPVCLLSHSEPPVILVTVSHRPKKRTLWRNVKPVVPHGLFHGCLLFTLLCLTPTFFFYLCHPLCSKKSAGYARTCTTTRWTAACSTGGIWRNFLKPSARWLSCRRNSMCLSKSTPTWVHKSLTFGPFWRASVYFSLLSLYLFFTERQRVKSAFPLITGTFCFTYGLNSDFILRSSVLTPHDVI